MHFWSGEQQPKTLAICCIQGIILPSYIGIMMSHEKDLYWPTRISWNVTWVLITAQISYVFSLPNLGVLNLATLGNPPVNQWSGSLLGKQIGKIPMMLTWMISQWISDFQAAWGEHCFENMNPPFCYCNYNLKLLLGIFFVHDTKILGPAHHPSTFPP